MEIFGLWKTNRWLYERYKKYQEENIKLGNEHFLLKADNERLLSVHEKPRWSPLQAGNSSKEVKALKDTIKQLDSTFGQVHAEEKRKRMALEKELDLLRQRHDAMGQVYVQALDKLRKARKKKKK